MATTSYDQVPYLSYPFPQTHPGRLAMIATVFGVEPPAVETSRILELGCAGGGNVVPMAVELPGAKLVGIDLSEAQVAVGQQAIKSVGLQNVELRAQSILDFDSDDQFDYIISHGVWSWVPHEVRQKIFDICRRNLTPRGVAYISYNTYPGWHMRGIVRDMMMFHARKFEAAHERVAQSRALLNFLAKSAPKQNNSYALLLKTEAQLLSNKADSYLLHEHLEKVNEPVYFYQFEEQARAYELQYLGEAHLAAMTQQDLAPEVSATVRQLSGDIVELEQYLDFLRNRTFRQTLLCRAGIEIDRHTSAARVMQLSVMSSARAVDPLDLSADVDIGFANRHGTLRTNEPLLKAAMALLGRDYPRVWPVKQLLEEACQLVQPDDANPERVDLTATNLVHSDMRGFVGLYAYQPRWAAQLEPAPLASPLARWQADGGNMVSSLVHELVRLDDLQRQVLLLCDGQRDQAQIYEKMTALLRKGAVILPEAKRETSVEKLAEETLRWLLDSCLLLRSE